MTTTDFLLLLAGTVLPLGVIWGLFWLVLRPERCYGYNRWLLLLAPPLAVALLLLPRPALPAWLAAPAASASGFTTVLLPAIGPGSAVAASPAPPAWQTALLALYALGVTLGLSKLAWRLVQVRRLRRRFGRAAGPGYTLAYTGGQLPTSSFGSTIFWDETTALPPTEAAAVLAHEVAHVRQHHSYGLLWLEIWRAVLWFNPFAHLLLPALRLTHELLADAAAAPGPAAPAYSTLLARLAVRRLARPGYFTLLQPFTFSFTLTRIAMLQKSTPVRRWKQWLVLPMLGGVFFVACQQTQEAPTPKAGNKPAATNSIILRQGDKAAFMRAVEEFCREDSLRNGALSEQEMINIDEKPVLGQPGMAVMTIGRVKNNQSRARQSASDTTAETHTYVTHPITKMAKLPGSEGLEPIVQAIQANVVYPKGTDGKPLPAGVSYATFTVGANGVAQDPKIIKSAGSAYDAAVLNAIGKLPRFEPAQKDGKAVAISYTVPVIFKP